MKTYKYNRKRNACGEKVRELRLKKGLTQMQLAARMQVQGIILEQKNISRIELGARVVADFELRAFAKVLCVKMEDLMEEPVEAGSFEDVIQRGEHVGK